jgi:hypothetical protein
MLNAKTSRMMTETASAAPSVRVSNTAASSGFSNVLRWRKQLEELHHSRPPHRPADPPS